MSRYTIETKQLSGHWERSSAKDCKATSKKQAVAAAQVQNTKYQCPKRAVDTLTGEVLAVFGDNEIFAARAKAMQSKVRSAEKLVAAVPGATFNEAWSELEAEEWNYKDALIHLKHFKSGAAHA